VDVSDRTITLREPKSGKALERTYMPKSVSRKLAEYILLKKSEDFNRYSLVMNSLSKTPIAFQVIPIYIDHSRMFHNPFFIEELRT
jgi:hypothetical protein